jgi:hypothetical protein
VVHGKAATYIMYGPWSKRTAQQGAPILSWNFPFSYFLINCQLMLYGFDNFHSTGNQHAQLIGPADRLWLHSHSRTRRRRRRARKMKYGKHELFEWHFNKYHDFIIRSTNYRYILVLYLFIKKFIVSLRCGDFSRQLSIYSWLCQLASWISF